MAVVHPDSSGRLGHDPPPLAARAHRAQARSSAVTRDMTVAPGSGSLTWKRTQSRCDSRAGEGKTGEGRGKRPPTTPRTPVQSDTLLAGNDNNKTWTSSARASSSRWGRCRLSDTTRPPLSVVAAADKGRKRCAVLCWPINKAAPASHVCPQGQAQAQWTSRGLHTDVVE